MSTPIKTEEWPKKFRKLLIDLDDLHVNPDLQMENEPIKGDIYFDGVEIEKFISSLIESAKREGEEKGRAEVVEELRAVCYGNDDALDSLNEIIEVASLKQSNDYE